ncbi:hypothetical protein QSO_1852 [Clostridioides difficile P31]|nr:hypothetical protein QO5_2167 [Clostridioides difficile F253]EQK88010.1 hypothetical protein QSO_1852 [Clostridioides difficile P31]
MECKVGLVCYDHTTLDCFILTIWNVKSEFGELDIEKKIKVLY